MDQAKRNPAIILTTRMPAEGSCKTRLSPLLSPAERCELQKAMIADELESIAATGTPCLVFVTPAGTEDAFARTFGFEGPVLPQTGNGLGEMMRNAFREAFAMGYSPCILVGSDIPRLDPASFHAALQALEREDVVLGPTEDGGYCLIGMSRLHEAPFRMSGYGGSSVLQQTVQAIREAGLTCGLLEARQDMDTPDDLAALATDSPLPQCPRTCALVQRFAAEKPRPCVSVIVPVYNEEAAIGSLLAQLEPLRDRCQAIFVDGGSTDGTRGIVEAAGYPCLSGKGRGNQLNAGAAAATGDVLFFLHCDSQLPPDPLRLIRKALEQADAGFFGIRFDTPDRLMGICARQSNRRAKHRQIPFGDQGIFIRRRLFWELGGFPEIPLMEDYEFSMRARAAGVRFACTGQPITTLARRFGKGALSQLKVMWRMHVLRFLYRRGRSPEELRERYRRINR